MLEIPFSLAGDGVEGGTEARLDYKAVIRTAIKLPLLRAGTGCLRPRTHVCSLARSCWVS